MIKGLYYTSTQCTNTAEDLIHIWFDKMSGTSWWYVWWNMLIPSSAMNISSILQRSIVWSKILKCNYLSLVTQMCLSPSSANKSDLSKHRRIASSVLLCIIGKFCTADITGFWLGPFYNHNSTIYLTKHPLFIF